MALKLAETSCRVRYPSHQINTFVTKSDGLNLFGTERQSEESMGERTCHNQPFQWNNWVSSYVLEVLMAVMTTPCGHCSAFARGCFLLDDLPIRAGRTLLLLHCFCSQVLLFEVHGYCFFNALPKSPILCHLSGGKEKECSFHCAEGQRNVWWDETNSHHLFTAAYFMW